MNNPIDTLFGEGTPLTQVLPDYENRREQKLMAEAVSNAFQTAKHLIVEAGTGVGKSFAYLAPAIAQAVAGLALRPDEVGVPERGFRDLLPFDADACEKEVFSVERNERERLFSSRVDRRPHILERRP